MHSATVTLVSLLVFFSDSGFGKQILETKKDKISYTIGWGIGSNFKTQSIDIDTDIMLRGLKDALGGIDSSLNENEMQGVMQSFQKEMMEKQAKTRNETGEKNKKEGEEFLVKNKQKKGVKTTATGLQYRVIEEGKGDKPELNDTVTVNYKGTLIDGSVFDSSYERGQPATFPVNGVIPGWTEALQLMSKGSKYELFIPSELAYGERGAGNIIGSNAALVFTVELISIEKNVK